MQSPNKSQRALAALMALALSNASCTTVEDHLDGSQFEIAKEPELGGTIESPETMLATLEQLSDSPILEQEIGDIRKSLEAQVSERKGEKSAAVRLWFEAMMLARGRFAKRAFEGWLKAYTKQLDKKLDRVVLARLILAETRSGSASQYLTNKNLTTETALIAILDQQVPEMLTPRDSAREDSNAEEPPIDKGLPDADPLLSATAAKSCKSTQSNVARWQMWQNSLPDDIRIYWQGLIQQCSDQGAKALETLRSVYPRLAKYKATQALAVEAATRVAELERALDQKASAADTYSSLMGLYALPGVSPTSMGLPPYAYLIRRIGDTLWAARYRATVSDYENAKRFSQSALDLINTAATDPDAQTKPRREELANLRADAFHTLAYRIAIEKQEYESAASMMTLAKQSQYLSREWSNRLDWFAGLYEFLAGNITGAQIHWEKLIRNTDDDTMRAMARFWLAFALQKTGKQAASTDMLDALITEFPLSYYSVVAIQQSNMKARLNWRQRFGDPQVLAKKLRKRRSYNLQTLLSDNQLRPLLIRAQIAAELGNADLAKLLIGELESAMLTRLDLSRETDAFVYLSRLQYHTGQFLACIGLTTKLARSNKNFWQDHPEQIFLYFPRPYIETYVQSAIETSLDKELLLSISRQESGFTPDIRSGANAIGIMQLIRPTAKLYSVGLASSDQRLDDLLTNPRTNIRIGSKFLQHLNTTFKGFGPAIFGGYNAGEYAMKTWLQRRASSDPLMFVELIPFGETKDYIKNVWRNLAVYRYLEPERGSVSWLMRDRAERHSERRAAGRWTL